MSDIHEARFQIWRLGDTILDEQHRQLRRFGTTLRTEPMVIDLLLALARRQGELATRCELATELWPGIRVTAASLRRVVSQARRALGDDGQRQRVIRTVYGRGYRMSAAGIDTSSIDPA